MKIIPPKKQKFNLKTFEAQVKHDVALAEAQLAHRTQYAKVREAQAALAALEAESEDLWQAVQSAQHFADLNRHDPNLPTMIL